MNIYFDIETLPTDDESVIAEIGKTITSPANYKKPETIAQWMEENYESMLAEKVAKTSFDGLYGRVACIAWAIGDGEVVSSCGGSSFLEIDAISTFYDWVESNGSVFVGHNIAGFDLPFLKHRSMILGIKPPKTILEAMNAKPWDKSIADTMLMWSADREKRVSMNRLCKAFGIADKGDFDGSMVAETWKTDPQKVIDYCKDDVERTRQIYKRMMFM